MLPRELNSTLEQVDLLHKDSLIGKVFKYIFRSQATNLDSIAAFVAHLVNCLLKDFQVSEDSSTNPEGGMDFMMSNKVFYSMDAMDKYFNFVKDAVVVPLSENTILCTN
jgi:hypothetical protein